MRAPTKQVEEKLYYSISEVSQMTGIEAYVLRFWEKEFPMLKPKKNRGGNRVYQRRDIEMVNRIRKLLYEENYTIEGARNRLRSLKATPERQDLIQTGRMRTTIGEIRKEVEDLLNWLDSDDMSQRV